MHAAALLLLKMMTAAVIAATMAADAVASAIFACPTLDYRDRGLGRPLPMLLKLTYAEP